MLKINRSDLILMIGFVAAVILGPIIMKPFGGGYPDLLQKFAIFGIFAIGFNILFGLTGYLSFGHAAFLGALTENHTRVFLANGEVEDIAVHGGFVEVSDNTVSILSDAAELGGQIDIERARDAKGRAEERLRHEHDAEAVSALGRAHARLNAAGAEALTPRGN